jgi:MoaA/NifB/PqqE/SkfB family radical SAM enzyme
MNEKTFCVNPWVALHYQFGQGYNPCCVYANDIDANNILEYSQSSELSELKQQLIKGEQAPGCRICWQEEAQGYSSKRIRDNVTYGKVFNAKFHANLSQLSDQFVRYYVRLGNHCNLKCVTCNDFFSTGWVSENKKFNGVAFNQPIMIKKVDPIWQTLRDNASGIGKIEFVGGEPFMMLEQEQADLFKYLAESGHSKHITLMYNTNGTRMPDEQLEYWPYFKQIDISLSMDGIGDRFEYLRNPAIWQQFVENLNRYKKIEKVRLLIVHTTSVLNAGYLGEVHDFCKTHDLNVFYNILHYPLLLDLHRAPAKTKTWIHDQLESIDDPVIKNIQSQLQLYKEAPNDAQDILDYCLSLDSRRGNSIAQAFPELYKQLNADC